MAAALGARGVGAGDVVALMMGPSIDYAVGLAGIVLASGVATGLNPRLGPNEVGAIMARCRPRLAIRDEALDLPPAPATVPVLARSELAGVVCHHPDPTPARVPRSPHDPVVIIWTSGTTGTPKGAWFDHEALRAAVWSAGAMTAPFDRRLVAVPFAHAGYMAKLWEQLAWGTTLVIAPAPWTADDTPPVGWAASRCARRPPCAGTGTIRSPPRLS